MRVEKDSLGELPVPDDAYYGIHTQRSLQNFQISRLRWHPELLAAIVTIKCACARANRDLGLLNKEKAGAIEQACQEVSAGKLAGQFPLDVFQAGSGTSTHMNVNEVIANRANELLGGRRGDRGLVHPNDDVNMGQSTNDVMPSAIRLAALKLAGDAVVQADLLIHELREKSHEFQGVLKAGRTHLQDAVPMTLGQEFGAWATAVELDLVRLKVAREGVGAIGLGGNAVGTGLNTPPKFRGLALKHLVKLGRDVRCAEDLVERTQFLTDISALSSALKSLAIDLTKIGNDLRLLSSGPATGLHELNLPPVEPGSSIMPGKVNPSIVEAVNMACCRVIGNDAAITLACAAGTLELNTNMPLIGHAILESLEILANSVSALSKKCIPGITANAQQCRWYVEHSAALATALTPYIGYDRAAALVKEALAAGKSVKALALERQVLPRQQLERILDPGNLTQPNLKG